jgi:hypothetical protein
MPRSFSGSAQYLQSTTPLATAYPCTFSAWVNTTANTSVGTVMSVGSSTSATNYLALLIGGSAGTGKITFEIDAGGASNDATSGGTNTNGVWCHIAGVATSTTLRQVYLNGVAGTSNTTSTSFPTLDRAAIGGVNLGSGTPTSLLNGIIAECSIWNVALRDEEILALSQGVSALRIRPLSLVSYVPVKGTASPEPDMYNAATYTVTGATQSTNLPPLSAAAPNRNLKPHIFSPGNAR